jgi:hypothetical protein
MREASLSRSPGYLNKEIFVLCSSHGAAGDGDDRQGNGACRGNAASLFHLIFDTKSRNVLYGKLMTIKEMGHLWQRGQN